MDRIWARELLGSSQKSGVVLGLEPTPHLVTMQSSLRFLMAARQCEIRDLEQLMGTSSLVQLLGQMVHALQKERGLSNIFLASCGTQAAPQRLGQIADCDALALELQAAFGRLDHHAARSTHGARLYSRIAYVLQGFDALAGLRQRIALQRLSTEECTTCYSRIVAGLLAVVFEAADSAFDPEISRLLVASFHFMQGKEFAGQERAVGSAAFGAALSDAARQQQWLHLIDSQERCFQVFLDFAQEGPVARWRDICTPGAELAELERLRRVGCTTPPGQALPPGLSNTWFNCCTQRMNAMHAVENHLAQGLLQLCQAKLEDARAALHSHQLRMQALGQLPADATPADNAFFSPAPQPGAATAATAALQTYGHQLERSVLELVQDQSQRLQAMRDELEAVRSTLHERKLVERAKGLLMAHRQLSEGDAHKLLRQTAMGQNRRLVEVAEAVLATADLLPLR